MPILEIRHLYKSYTNNDIYANENISLAVDKGEIVALVGESGCGKTTLLRIIAGLEIPQKGEIFIEGNPIFNASLSISPEKRKIGMVFQDYALFPHLDVRQNILFGVKEKSKTYQQTLLQELLQLIGLEGYEKRYPHELSGGQQQRIALARALAHKPLLLLLDEPFSNLDELLKMQVRTEIAQIIRKSGSTAILVTHDTQDALSIADKIAILRKGQVVQYDSPENLYKKPNSLYVAEFFGAISTFPIHKTDNWVWLSSGQKPFYLQYEHFSEVGIRPQHFQCVFAPTKNALEAKIKSINFHGTHYHIEAYTQEQKIIFYTTEKPLQQTVFLTCDEKNLLFW